MKCLLLVEAMGKKQNKKKTLITSLFCISVKIIDKSEICTLTEILKFYVTTSRQCFDPGQILIGSLLYYIRFVI